MDPRTAYREDAVRGATRVGLVIFLYEQAILDLRQAAMAMEQGDVEFRTRQINHAMSIISHLQGTLDRDQGGKVSLNLDRFYGSVRGRLIEAQMLMSTAILQEQISLLLSVREAWIAVDNATSKSASLPSFDAGGHAGAIPTLEATPTTWSG